MIGEVDERDEARRRAARRVPPGAASCRSRGESPNCPAASPGAAPSSGRRGSWAPRYIERRSVGAVELHPRLGAGPWDRGRTAPRPGRRSRQNWRSGRRCPTWPTPFLAGRTSRVDFSSRHCIAQPRHAAKDREEDLADLYGVWLSIRSVNRTASPSSSMPMVAATSYVSPVRLRSGLPQTQRERPLRRPCTTRAAGPCRGCSSPRSSPRAPCRAAGG